MVPEQERPGPHPEPPNDIFKRRFEPIYFKASLFRVHKENRAPLYFGRSRENRFDSPGGEYGILYLATDVCCAFRETVGRLTQYKIVTRTLLEKRRISQIGVARELLLVDLSSGRGLTPIDADGRLFTGEYRVAQLWALALWNHPDKPDGLYYRSRHDPERFCVALYDRVEPELRVENTESFLDESFKERLECIVDTYKYGLEL